MGGRGLLGCAWWWQYLYGLSEVAHQIERVASTDHLFDGEHSALSIRNRGFRNPHGFAFSDCVATNDQTLVVGLEKYACKAEQYIWATGRHETPPPATRTALDV